MDYVEQIILLNYDIKKIKFYEDNTRKLFKAEWSLMLDNIFLNKKIL